MKITATPFHQSVPICFKQIVACKPSVVLLFVLQSIVFDQIKEKSSNSKSKGSYGQGFLFGKYGVQ